MPKKGLAMQITRRHALAGLAAAAAPLPAWAARELEVDVALVLAADSSGSIDQYRFDLQKDGYARAFRSERVMRAIANGATGKIAATFFYWSEPKLQAPVVPWTILSDRASLEGFAAAIAGPKWRISGGTSISGALYYSEWLLSPKQLPWVKPLRRVVDISGDGPNNKGVPAYIARDILVEQGITINGLPIQGTTPGVDEHYTKYVIGGPGSFTRPAQNFESFGEAILDKLVLEIA